MSNSARLELAALEDAPARPATSVGVVLIHGVTGMPTEMRPLARHLQSLGYQVETPQLPGHGAGHRQLWATTWRDWLTGARSAFAQLSAECDDVMVVGLCGGGLLGTLLAAEDPRVKGLVVLSPDLGLRIPGPAKPWTRVLMPVASRIPLLRRYGYWTEKPPYGLKDPRLQELVTRSIAASKRGHTTEYGTFRTCVAAMDEMIRLQAEVRRRAASVRCPTRILHSVEDTMFSIRNATVLYSLLGTSDKSIRLITGCDHVMTVDLRKDDVARDVGAFIARLSSTAAIRRMPDA